MICLLIVMLSFFNPPKLVIVYQISTGDPMINNIVEETYAYNQGYFMREIRAPHLYPGFTRTIYNINDNKASMLTKHFTKGMIHHFGEPSTTLIKKLEVADYSITYDKKDRKTILGYEAYKTIIEDRTNDKTIVVYTCEDITDTRFQSLQLKYPLLKGLPLSYEDHKRSSIAIGISQDVDESLFELNEKDAFMVLDDEGFKNLVPLVTEGRTLEEYKEYLESRTQEESDKKKEKD